MAAHLADDLKRQYRAELDVLEWRRKVIWPALTALGAWVGYSSDDAAIAGMLLGGSVGFLAGHLWQRRIDSTLSSTFARRMLQTQVASRPWTESYDTKGFMTLEDFNTLGIFPRPDSFHATHTITGRWDGTDFATCDIEAYEIWESAPNSDALDQRHNGAIQHRHAIFRGEAWRIEAGFGPHAPITLWPKALAGGTGLIVGDAEFDKRHVLRCDSLQEALRLLTPGSRERLLALAAYAPITLHWEGHVVWLLLATGGARFVTPDALDPLRAEMDYQHRIERMAQTLETLGLVDHIENPRRYGL